MNGGLVGQARRLLHDAQTALAGTDDAELLARVESRLGEPLRVALAGKVKAGKSTLLNALVGERLAPTDAGECTRIVTWYRDGVAYIVTLEDEQGRSVQVPFRREQGALDIDLGGRNHEQVRRLLVDWPSRTLREMVLIDTPGIASISTEISDRTNRFLTPDDGRPTEADAVVYLMRHLHATDHRFLESFHDEAVSAATPVNTIGILSRADEIGSGRLDAMDAAARIAQRYKSDPQIRRLCQTVVPVAGLIAETGATLREDEFRALARLSGVPVETLAPLLLGADRFASRPVDGVDLDPAVRLALLDRLGMFGIRTSIELIRTGQVSTASGLARELLTRSGIDRLRSVLATQFASRRDVLKARAALAAAELTINRYPRLRHGELGARLEQIRAGAHEFAETRLLNAVRAEQVAFDADLVAEVERILGVEGFTPGQRLGLGTEAPSEAIRERAVELVTLWQRRAENPFSSREQADAARVVVRSLEGILVTV